MDDEKLIDSFVSFRRNHRVSVDDVMCDPQLRDPFLREAQQAVGIYPERDILKRLLYLRKRERIPRASAN